MKTSYEDTLPSVEDLKKFVTECGTETEYGHLYTWEDGGGAEIRIVADAETILVTLYDHESDDNAYPDGDPAVQLALREVSDEGAELFKAAHADLIWEWDESGEVWYTAAFWSEDAEWHSSADWEENHDESSAEWLISELRETTQV